MPRTSRIQAARSCVFRPVIPFSFTSCLCCPFPSGSVVISVSFGTSNTIAFFTPICFLLLSLHSCMGLPLFWWLHVKIVFSRARKCGKNSHCGNGLHTIKHDCLLLSYDGHLTEQVFYTTVTRTMFELSIVSL